jgi:hypothetical protein
MTFLLIYLLAGVILFLLWEGRLYAKASCRESIFEYLCVFIPVALFFIGIGLFSKYGCNIPLAESIKEDVEKMSASLSFAVLCFAVCGLCAAATAKFTCACAIGKAMLSGVIALCFCAASSLLITQLCVTLHYAKMFEEDSGRIERAVNTALSGKQKAPSAIAAVLKDAFKDMPITYETNKYVLERVVKLENSLQKRD